VISQIWEPTTAKQMKIDPYCQQQNCSPANVLFRYAYYIDTAGCSSAKGRQSEYSRCMVIFQPLYAMVCGRLQQRRSHRGSAPM